MTVSRKRRKVKKKDKKRKVRRKVSGTTRAPPKKKKRKKRRKLTPRQLKQSRSAAAKRGWETRRKKQIAVAPLAEQLDFLRRPEVARQLADDIIRTGLADRITPEQLLRPGMVRNEDSMILAQLVVANQLGNFDERAYELADMFKWDVREVYTLWHSP